MTGPAAGDAGAGAEPAELAVRLTERLRRSGSVYAEDEAAALLDAATDVEHLERMVVRRVLGVPLEHVVGYVEFAGLRLAVDDGVFVPRRRTELLVDLARKHLTVEDPAVQNPAPQGRASQDRTLQDRTLQDRADGGRRARPGTLVELCCGCAPVATAVATHAPGTEVHAVDIDPVAVACARRNLAPVGGTAHVGDLDAAVPHTLAGRVDVLVANAPYVPTDAVRLMPVEAREHEPRIALDGGPDGLSTARRVVDVATRWLAPGGLLVVETSRDQAPVLARHARRRGMTARVVRDEALEATAVAATATTAVVDDEHSGPR